MFRSGSNSSIPDLIKQHSIDRLQKPTRPASASTRKTRPPSGRKERPQSAKESSPFKMIPNVLGKLQSSLNQNEVRVTEYDLN